MLLQCYIGIIILIYVLILKTLKYNKMKKLILTCALITSVSVVSFAQNAQTSVTMAPGNSAVTTTAAAPNAPGRQQPNMEHMADERAKRMKNQFGLNDEQYKGVYNAQLAYMNKMLDLHNQGKQPTPQERQQIVNDLDAGIKAAMTPEQFAKYSATRANRNQLQPAAVPAAK